MKWVKNKKVKFSEHPSTFVWWVTSISKHVFSTNRSWTPAQTPDTNRSENQPWTARSGSQSHSAPAWHLDWVTWSSNLKNWLVSLLVNRETLLIKDTVNSRSHHSPEAEKPVKPTHLFHPPSPPSPSTCSYIYHYYPQSFFLLFCC